MKYSGGGPSAQSTRDAESQQILRAERAELFSLQQKEQSEGRMYAGNGGRAVYAAEFPADATEDQVRDLFAQCGEVQGRIHWHWHEHHDSGYFFVNFATSADAYRAVVELDGMFWAPQGSAVRATQLVVNQRDPPIKTTMFDTTAGPLGLEFEDDITGGVHVTKVDAGSQACTQGVMVSSVISRVNGSEIRCSADLREAFDAANHHDPSAVEFKFLVMEDCHQANNGGRSVYVGNVPDIPATGCSGVRQATESDIHALFPSAVRVMKKTGFFFVHFATSELAYSAVLEGATMRSPSGEVPLRLEQQGLGEDMEPVDLRDLIMDESNFEF
jgi:RNA recognition motif-containing protein